MSGGGRVALVLAGAVLAASLFLPWFAGVTGWEHWVWADVVLVVLAADLVATAFVRPIVAQRVIVAGLCGLGIAVVLGHGFEPRVRGEGFEHVAAGPYLALVALSVGAVLAISPWPRVAGPLLLVVAAGGLVAALFSGWGAGDPPPLTVDGSVTFYAMAEPNGFERWHVLDVALLALAAALVALAVASATGRLARAAPGAAHRAAARARVILGVLAAASVAAAACVVVSTRSHVWVGDGGRAEGAAMGTLAALLALAAALAGLALLRPPGRAGRAG